MRPRSLGSLAPRPERSERAEEAVCDQERVVAQMAAMHRDPDRLIGTENRCHLGGCLDKLERHDGRDEARRKRSRAAGRRVGGAHDEADEQRDDRGGEESASAGHLSGLALRPVAVKRGGEAS